ncbi:MAG TPA: transketolase family protein [Sedimentisphaerales bacterium]|nr:transketolase family protein [Sedimentisphaerales bacterium]
MSQKSAPRDVLGRTLTDLAEKDPNIVVLDADFWPASKIAQYKDRFPDRFIEVGIAEQNMMGIAAGLSTVGFTCFASTLCVFCSRRACDQVTTSIALPRLNVKILGLYAGLFVGKNGASHQALEDIAIMRSIANMTVVQPADALETEQVVRFAAEYDGPMYVRVGRDPRPQLVPDNYKFRLGKACTIRDGKDVTLIACGDVVENALTAAASLAKKKIDARVINMSSIKPIDEEAIVKAAQETGKIVTIDNHNILGGLGSAVCEVVAEKMPVKVKRIGVKDIFGKSGTNEQMEKHFGLRAQDIEEEVLAFLKN